MALISIYLERSWRCRADFLEISDGLRGLPTWNSTGRFCVRSHRGRVITSTGNLMAMRFKTDSSVTGRGFIVRVRASKIQLDISPGLANTPPT